MTGHCTHSCNGIRHWEWDISEIIHIEFSHETMYAVLILNRTISQKQQFIKKLWNNATVRATVDGGTIHWDTFLSKLSDNDQQNMKLPDFICGDFDSITENVLMKFKNKGCKVIHTPDQDHTDFTKALIELNKYCNQHEKEIDHVLAISQCSGRIDQIMGNIQTLHLVKERHLLNSKTNVYLLADDSISWLLYPGYHIIAIPEQTRKYHRSWCSLVPIGEACTSVTTTGLKWNLDSAPLKFGELVSTSNAFDGSEQVTVKCSHRLLWSMKIPSIAGG